MKKVDRDDVALDAGVSSATVSRVFNNPSSVSEAKRQRVLDSAKKLGWSPNKFASALARSSSGRILFMDCNKLSVHDSENADFYANLYKTSLETILREVETSPYHLMIDLDGHARPGDYDGVILFDVDSPAQLDSFIDSGILVVAGHHTASFPRGYRFATDNRLGGVLAARHLVETGHRKTAYITAKLTEITAHAERFTGFCSVIPRERLRLVEGGLGTRGGYESVRKLEHDIRSHRIDSIAVVNDLTAVGVYQGLIDMGFRVPRDVSLVGYDNMPFLNLLPIRLTTIDLELGKVYHSAVQHLLTLLSSGTAHNQSCEIPQLRLHPPVLVPGASVRNHTVRE